MTQLNIRGIISQIRPSGVNGNCIHVIVYRHNKGNISYFKLTGFNEMVNTILESLNINDDVTFTIYPYGTISEAGWVSNEYKVIAFNINATARQIQEQLIKNKQNATKK